MKSPFFWKIATPIVILIILVMTILGISLTSQEKKRYDAELRTTLLQEARLISSQALPIIKASPSDLALNKLAISSAGFISARVTIILPNGVVVGESNYDLAQMENHLQRPEIQQALKGQEAVDIRYSVTLKANYLYAAVPIMEGQTIYGVARVSLSTQKIDTNIRNIEKLIFFYTLGMTAVGVIVTLLISYFTLKPLRDLTHYANQIVSPKKMDGISGHYRDEVHQLEFSINQMANELMQQISSYKAESIQLSAVLTSMSDGIIMTDKHGKVKLLNPSARLIFSIDPDLEKNLTLTEAVQNYQIVDLWKKALDSGKQHALSIDYGPERTYIQVVATPLEGSTDGDVLLTFQDLTRVRKLEMVRQDFVSNVSHELRTPLTSLKALIDTLKNGAVQDPPAAQKFLNQMDQEIDNLIQMVEELLELSKIESGKVPLVLEMVDARDLIQPAVERMRLQIKRARLTLKTDFPKESYLVKADPQRIQQVVINLVHNAVKFTTPGGTITVGAHPDKSFMVFYVQDTGRGIAPDDLERIFERFFKADKSRSTRGTGLGLSIARHIIESHSGKIWAESVWGKGSTFYFSLPLS